MALAGSILPVAIHKNKLYFLFGKENEFELTPGFSDFGGGVENGETPYQTAIREGAEELTGFLGNAKEIHKRIQYSYKIIHQNYHIHIFPFEYDENLPTYYNNNHRFLWEKMKHSLSKTKLFEKCEIQWFSIEDIQKRRKEFRFFYREMVDKILEEAKEIRAFIKSKSKSKSK